MQWSLQESDGCCEEAIHEPAGHVPLVTETSAYSDLQTSFFLTILSLLQKYIYKLEHNPSAISSEADNLDVDQGLPALQEHSIQCKFPHNYSIFW